MLARPCNDTGNKTLSPGLPRQCQCDRWSIIFTNPDDFVPLDLEIDRWLIVVRQAFADRGIRPRGLPAHNPTRRYNWTRGLSRGIFAEIVESAIRRPSLFRDLQEPVRSNDTGLSGRFVIVVDDALRNQQTFTYWNRQGLPSPLEFLEWADVLRTRQEFAAKARAVR